MEISIRTKNIELTSALRNQIEKEFNSLEKFAKIFQEKYFNSFNYKAITGRRGAPTGSSYFGKGKPRAEVWVEIEKESLHHQKGPVFRVEAQIRFPGKSIRSESLTGNLRQAVIEVKDELQREFKQYQERLKDLTEKRQRELKKEFRFASGAKFKRKKGERIREEGI